MKRVLQRTPIGVARTAVLIAAARANEQGRLHRLFDDPLAAGLVEAAGSASDLNGVRTLAGDHFVLRTRYFDDELLGTPQPQVVIMAAGLDTRAFRLQWPPGTTLFELDLPELLEFKEDALRDQLAQPACERVVVPCDLRDDWATALIRAGFDPKRPTAWLLEGLFMFLPPDAGEQVLYWVSALSARGSTLALEHVNRAFRELPQMKPVHQRFDALDARWQSDVEDPVEWLDGYGWHATVTHQVDLAARHDRAVPAITDPRKVGDARIWLASAVRTA
ncbi:Leucine carboxyl methyltransferase [Lentzea albidocapillata subsp. violacea]|uniref:S-adenosyl-L-methionine-dependent methyltransferase n=1 Tax=Lentzea albidocapillata subsp. violacea TaxID=128104 RepID=A0A1G8WT31_9PSEU|nr:SAM-dependent methyltransferase [Lentzea albidocapillata]SDJ81539.1 Leucine carboxyl methyltransferase [Lentzea albidocapillata subsp. violacea]